MSESLRVAHLSAYTYGGAAFAARRLHTGLRQTGVDSRFWYGAADPQEQLDESYQPLPLRGERNYGLLKPLVKQVRRRQRRRVRRDWRRHLQHRPEGFEVFTPARQFQDSFLDLQPLDCQLLNLHWLGHIADIPSLFASVPYRIPIVWTLHDMNPLTGGCHYSHGCDRFRQGCGQCPQVAEPLDDDVSRYSMQVKSRAYRGKRLHVVTPSRWLGDLAAQSPVWPPQTEFSVIPYGLELDQYQPDPTQSVRRRLGIAPNEFVFAFAAEDVANRRKGLPHLIRALQSLPAAHDWHALVFGGGQLPESLPDWLHIHALGYQTEAAEKARLYSAADVFVLPSLEDNQPQTGLEALACGTPVVAFDAGGIPEYVTHLENGWIAKQGDVEDLARQLLHAANQPELLPQLGSEGRARMEAQFSLDRQARDYEQLYRSLLESAASSPVRPKRHFGTKAA